MEILKDFFSLNNILSARMDVWRALDVLPTLGSETSKRIYAAQGGWRLSEIESLSVRRLIRQLAIKVGLSCDLHKCSARRQAPSGIHKLPWHQDFAPMRLDEGKPGAIAWVPLDPIDGSRPTLEIASEEDRKAHHRDDRRFLETDDNRDRSDAVIVSELEIGDIVLFSPYEPHRTYCTPDMRNERLSLDLRFQ